MALNKQQMIAEIKEFGTLETLQLIAELYPDFDFDVHNAKDPFAPVTFPKKEAINVG